MGSFLLVVVVMCLLTDGDSAPMAVTTSVVKVVPETRLLETSGLSLRGEGPKAAIPIPEPSIRGLEQDPRRKVPAPLPAVVGAALSFLTSSLVALLLRRRSPPAPAWATMAYGPSKRWGRFKATLKMKNWHKKMDLWFAHDDEVWVGSPKAESVVVMPRGPRGSLEDRDPDWDAPPSSMRPVHYTYDY